MPEDLKLAIAAAKAAGEIIKNDYGKKQIVHKKNVNDFVTKTDKAAEAKIIQFLKPTGYSILGEESGLTVGKNKTKQWVIDPIDGTSNFIRGLPFFAVSIALLDDTGTITLGVVYDPIHEKCYWASKGNGAFAEGTGLSTSKQSQLEESIILLEHGRAKKDVDLYAKTFHSLMLDNSATLLRQGSTALMLCYVARGSADAFISYGDELYDFAAGVIIAREAGAAITDHSGKQWSSSSYSLLACAPGIQKQIIKQTKKINT